MWHPNKPQWFVIWMATLLCIICWLFQDPPPESFVMPGVLVAVLFVWHVSADFTESKD